MPKTIQQSVTFPARAAKLFALYADSKLHSAVTGQQAKIGKTAGGRFSAFGGMLSGKILHVARNRTWVQTWRGRHWKPGDRDSVLILRFEDTPKGGRVDLVHANVPDHDAKGVDQGWRSYYWEPWKKLLAMGGKPGAKAKSGRKEKGAAKRAKGGSTRKPARESNRSSRR